MIIAQATITLNQHELDTITTALLILAGKYRDQSAQSQDGVWDIAAITAHNTRELADKMQRYGKDLKPA